MYIYKGGSSCKWVRKTISCAPQHAFIFVVAWVLKFQTFRILNVYIVTWMFLKCGPLKLLPKQKHLFSQIFQTDLNFSSYQTPQNPKQIPHFFNNSSKSLTKITFLTIFYQSHKEIYKSLHCTSIHKQQK